LTVTVFVTTQRNNRKSKSCNRLNFRQLSTFRNYRQGKSGYGYTVTVTVRVGLNPGSSSWTSQAAEPSGRNDFLTLVFLESAPKVRSLGKEKKKQAFSFAFPSLICTFASGCLIFNNV